MRLFSSTRILASTLLGAALLFLAACSLDVAMDSTGRLQILVEDTAGNPVPNINAYLLLDDRITVWRSTTTGTDGRAEFDASAGRRDSGLLLQADPHPGLEHGTR